MSASDYVTTTAEELGGRIDAAHRRFATLARAVPGDQPIGDAWTSRGVVGHVINVVNRYTAFDPSRLADTARGVDAINQREMEALADRSVEELLAMLDEEMQRFQEQWGPQVGLPLDLPIPFHGGATIDLQSGLTNLIGEFSVHGLDVAVASDVPWSIEDRDAELLCAFATQILPAYVRPANAERAVLHFDIPGVAPWALEVDGPSGTSRHPQPGETPDLVLAGPAESIALLFYQRVDMAEALARGVRVAGGARPELAQSFTSLFEEP